MPFRINVDRPGGNGSTYFARSYDIDDNGVLRFTDSDGHRRVFGRNVAYELKETDRTAPFEDTELVA